MTGIEIDFLLAAQKENRTHAYEFKRGHVDKNAEIIKLISKAACLDFKSIRLHDPEIKGEVLTLDDLVH